MHDAPLTITYYTDPLCAWCWAFEPTWRCFLREVGPGASWSYRMAGMIADWSRYGDPLNDVRTPRQMGPHWLEVSRATGVAIDSRIWHEDPPASSHPACIAVKAAEQQGRGAGEDYLRRARTAVMRDGRNIARREVLLELADEQGAVDATLDGHAFRRALDDGSAVAAFREDLREVRYREIGRFPSITLERAGRRGILIVGYRPLEVLRSALAALDARPPSLEPAAPESITSGGG